MKIDINILNEYNKNGLLHKQKHPDYNLYIWNYTPKVQYNQLWDDLTKRSRGLIIDHEGNIIAHCLPKFFNWEELNNEDIPNESFEITEKMDGSFGNIFWYDNKWIVSSRGSFISEQAIKANEIIKKYNPKNTLNNENNYICEIIYPQNIIVCRYNNYEGLVLLTAFNIKDGVEINRNKLEELDGYGWDIVKKYNGINDFNYLKQNVPSNKEGYVIRFKSGFRMKIKGEEYVRLHRILTNVSNRTIWEHLKDGRPVDELIENVPDEFYTWVKDEVNSFNTMFKITKSICEKIFYNEIKENMTRKEVAEIVMSKHKRYRGILFSLYDGKDIDNMIWKLLYPEYSKPFFKENEDV